jgi:hypothetical protein
MTPEIAQEALRQQSLLRALWRDAPDGAVAGWLRDGARFERGLQAYRAHAGALAERALAAAFPTLQQLLGPEAFAGLARMFWHHAPPVQGDLAAWGGALPDVVARDPQLAGEPYLADLARLEWAVHTAAHAADGGAPRGLEHLADAEPAQLRLQLQPGTALLSSVHPIVTLWQAHRGRAEDRLAPARAALAAGRGEHALVRRRGWPVEVLALDDAAARFTGAVLAGRSLGAALEAGGDGFDFAAWLIDALRSGALLAVTPRQDEDGA